MQKYFSLAVFVLSSPLVFCQRSVDGLIQAEKKFANTSLVVSTNEAFISFIDTAGIVFDKGKPVNGLKLYKKSAGNLKLKEENPQSLNQAEENFIQAYASQGAKAYESFLSSQSRINYAGFLPATNSEERKILLDSLPSNIHYTILGSGMSPMKDLGYVYGSADINDKQDGYLRIW